MNFEEVFKIDVNGKTEKKGNLTLGAFSLLLLLTIDL